MVKEMYAWLYYWVIFPSNYSPYEMIQAFKFKYDSDLNLSLHRKDLSLTNIYVGFNWGVLYQGFDMI